MNGKAMMHYTFNMIYGKTESKEFKQEWGEWFLLGWESYGV